MNFQEYLISKKIDSDAFRQAEPDTWHTWKEEFEQIHPNSFTLQKLNLINPVRRKYLLTGEPTPVAKPAPTAKPVLSKPAIKPVAPPAQPATIEETPSSTEVPAASGANRKRTAACKTSYTTARVPPRVPAVTRCFRNTPPSTEVQQQTPPADNTPPADDTPPPAPPAKPVVPRPVFKPRPKTS